MHEINEKYLSFVQQVSCRDAAVQPLQAQMSVWLCEAAWYWVSGFAVLHTLMQDKSQ